MVVGSVVKPSFYRDSLTLLRLCRELKDRVDVDEVAALMANAGMWVTELQKSEVDPRCIPFEVVSSQSAF